MAADPIKRDLVTYAVGTCVLFAILMVSLGGLYLKADRKQAKRVVYGQCYVAWDGDMICTVPSKVAK